MRRSWTEPWMAETVCASVFPDAWFPAKSESSAPAKRICNGQKGVLPCPVRKQCLEYALRYDERWGVWGGLSEVERRRLKRGRQAG